MKRALISTVLLAGLSLLAQAQARGCPVHFGRHMLDEQVQLMARFMLQD